MISAGNSSETDASERDPKSSWSPIPESRFHAESWYHPNKEHLGTSYVKGAHFLAEDISRFDAVFFNFTADAASTMDPEVRLQLETVYEPLESAGLPLDQVAGSRTGVYAGTCFRDNHDSLLRDPDTLARSFLTGNGAAMIANRISHFFDLRGPSLMVDTGCSTTLTLLHLACQSLRPGESDMAIVGGSNILLNLDMSIAGSNLSLFSAQGRCFAFNSRATGYERGDGIASMIIKPLIAADGKTATLTSPSQEAQEVLMQECYKMTGLDPRDTGFVEAHETGTQASDAIEAHSIRRVFGLRRSTECPLVVGSVKTNTGHTGAASGPVVVIKAVMAIEKQAIPPHPNFESPNENIAFDALNLKIPLSANAHAIIESPEILQRTTYYLATRIHESEENEELLDQLAFTLEQRRTRFPCTIAWSGSSITEAYATLDAPGLTTQRSMRAQWFAMGRELLDAYPVFCDTIHEVDACLKSMGATWSALEELERNAKESRLNQVPYSLPLSGVYPAGVTAHISGEGVAAYAAGAVTLKGALAIVYIRGDLTKRQDAEKALAAIRSGKVIIACVNSPSSVTISGDECAIEEIKTPLHGRGVFVRRLHVEAAYNSHNMLPLAEAEKDNKRITSAAEIAHPDRWVRNMVRPVKFLSAWRNLYHDDSDATKTTIDMLVGVGPHGAWLVLFGKRWRYLG
ncbi:ketoacyl-synt-domain-containing protein [Aspergillus uvarum CBS 121591]|uniref:Ketoacyl-synt-domain-containing protein n=1 Tax=Aspergillus uvarum CBS 121591 TaxID=1448315 RepID=A0A319D1G4_9EURO|nr:ketoacyl-synt-domain-containing protein [Aspergillus uvarum CBS 121591]PYH81778.1 ketoacyl-synt-domain-containing protein [Aspergillus uvarum CBS 121591]